MTISQQKKKIEHLAEAIVGKYFLADQKRALMEPIVSDESIIKCWDHSLAAHGLEALRMSLYMSVLSAMNSLLFDDYARTASLYNVCKMLEDERLAGLLRENYCKPFEINHLNDDREEEAKILPQKYMSDYLDGNLYMNTDEFFTEIESSDSLPANPQNPGTAYLIHEAGLLLATEKRQTVPGLPYQHATGNRGRATISV